MNAPISDIHELPDAARDICLIKPPLINGKHHFANYVVPVIAREMARDNRINAIQKAADWKA